MSLKNHLKCADNKYGEIGIEIEVEGKDLPNHDDMPVKKVWRVEVDPSLRGESREYVLDKPVNREDVMSSLEVLKQAYKNCKSKIFDTYRAGIHIHVNVQDMTPKHLMNFIFLYLMYEEALVDFCDKTRRGNHFCLRCTDATYLADKIAQAVSSGDLKVLNDEDIRYASINLMSLFKFGSVEFRALETTSDWKKVENWTKLLLCLKDAASTFNDPTEIIGQFSSNGFDGFSRTIFKEMFPIMQKLITEQNLYNGIRNIQFAAYSRNWSSVNLNIFKSTEDVFSGG